MKNYWTLLGRIILLAVCCLLSFTNMGSGQSTEMDHPTHINSTEVTVSFDSNVTHYYSFDAGPGEVTLLVASQGVGGVTYVQWQLSDQNMKSINGFEYLTASSEDQKLDRFKLTRKQTILLTVKCDLQNAREGRYRLGLGGAVGTGSPWLAGLPRRGILRLKMKDGSMKEIDLKDVAEVSVE